MQDQDPILESALHEVLGGKTPPDLIAQTLAKAGAQTTPPPKQPVARPRPAWRAWGTGLAAAAVVAILTGIAAIPALTSSKDDAKVAAKSAAKESALLDDVTVGTEDSAGGQYDLGTRAAGDTHVEVRDFNPATLTLNTPAEKRPNEPKGQPDNRFDGAGANPFVDTEDDALSTFALEHDTGSYAVMRGYLNDGNLPPEEAVRVEEFVNYFDYDYAKPAIEPFTITMDAAPSRFGQDLANCYLMRIGVQARQIPEASRKSAILTFVIDVSGSMGGDNRLGLVKRALAMLVDQLREGDQVGIATFGSRGLQYMDYLDVYRKDEILKAIDGLQTEGATNAEEGLKVGYDMANRAYREGFTNRLILCSDGVANVGQTQAKAIIDTIVDNRRKGITLSTVGFGMGNYDDAFMEQLGDKGDGHYAYVDGIEEAKRTFVDNLTGALEVVGRDVKIQLEFDPRVVKSYRLLGYVNRDVKDEDFRNDAVDGGEICSGHSATALYEVKLYEGVTGRIAAATIRYKEDENDDPREIRNEFFSGQVNGTWEAADKGFRLAGDAAEFAEILGASFYAKQGSLKAVLEDLEAIQYDYRNEKVDELIKLVKKAIELKK